MASFMRVTRPPPMFPKRPPEPEEPPKPLTSADIEARLARVSAITGGGRLGRTGIPGPRRPLTPEDEEEAIRAEEERLRAGGAPRPGAARGQPLITAKGAAKFPLQLGKQLGLAARGSAAGQSFESLFAGDPLQRGRVGPRFEFEPEGTAGLIASLGVGFIGGPPRDPLVPPSKLEMLAAIPPAEFVGAGALNIERALSQLRIGSTAAGLAAQRAGPAARRLATEEVGALRFKKPAAPAARGPGATPPAQQPAAGGGPPPKTPLGKVRAMWEEQPPKPPLGERLSDISRTVQEKTTDKFAGINALGPEAEQYAALVAGAPEAAFRHVRDTALAAAKIARRDSSAVDDLLNLQFMGEIAKEKGTQRLLAGGLKGEAEVKAALTQLEAELGPGRFAAVSRAADIINKHYKDLLQMKVDAGVVSKETADLLNAKYPHYNRIIYKFIAEEEQRATGGRALSVTRNDIRRLSEIGVEAGRERPTDALVKATVETYMIVARNKAANAIINAAQKNPKLAGQVKKVAAVRPVAQVEGEAVFRRPPGEIRGTMSRMVKGQREVWEVPSWLEAEVKHLGNLSMTDLERAGHFLNAVPRIGITGANPVFFVSNFAIDTLTAWMTEGVSPLSSLRRLAVNLRHLREGDDTLRQMLRSGGGFGGFSGKLPEELLKRIAKDGNFVVRTKANLRDLNPISILGDIGRAVENAPRTAVYELALRRGLSPSQAAFAARRATIDFARSGTAVKQANALFLYLNAGVQGTMIPARALRDNPASRWRLGGLTAAALGTYAWNRQFEEYKDVPAWAKYNSFIIMLPSNEYDSQGRKKPRYVVVIPNMREWGAFTGLLNYTLGRLDGDAPEDVTDFLRVTGNNLNPLSRFTGQGGLPVPTQIGETITELTLNRDVFRDRPIVPPELEGRPVDEQFDQRTTLAARLLGQAIGYSPMKLQHLFDGTMGGLGRSVISGVDFAHSKIAPDQPPPSVQAALDQLEDIQPPVVPADRVALERQKILAGLDPDVRNQVDDWERRAPERFPVVGELQQKVFREQGGQLFRSGQRAAQRATGLSARQTAEAAKALGGVFDELATKQKASDDALEAREINGQPYTGEMWRKERSEYGTLYRGALLGLGVIYPGAAQTQDSAEAWQEYREAVYTIAGSIQDRRSRGQTLLAAYRAIQPEGPTPETLDWDTYGTRQEEFLAGLSKDDRALLQEWRQASMTKAEREYDALSVRLREANYWEPWKITTQYQENPAFFNEYEEYLKVKSRPHYVYDASGNAVVDPGWVTWFQAGGDLAKMRAWDQAMEKLRLLIRGKDKDIEQGVVTFYGSTPLEKRR